MSENYSKRYMKYIGTKYKSFYYCPYCRMWIRKSNSTEVVPSKGGYYLIHTECGNRVRLSPRKKLMTPDDPKVSPAKYMEDEDDVVRQLANKIMSAETLAEADELERELCSLRMTELRRLCKIIGVRYIPNKLECIDYILNATVRSRERHELLRRFWSMSGAYSVGGDRA